MKGEQKVISLLNGKKPIPVTKAIRDYLHCGKCCDSIPAGQAMKDYERLSIGLTSEGLQVWCERHNVNVIHFDFRGTRILVNSGVAKKVSA
jgi:hypothetical protein